MLAAPSIDEVCNTPRPKESDSWSENVSINLPGMQYLTEKEGGTTEAREGTSRKEAKGE